MTSDPGIKPGPHWWKASALTTAPMFLGEIMSITGTASFKW